MESVEHHKPVGMDGDGSCSSCRCESGECSLIMRQKDLRQRRMAPLVIVPLLLLTGTVLLLVIGLGRLRDLSPDGKVGLRHRLSVYSLSLLMPNLNFE